MRAIYGDDYIGNSSNITFRTLVGNPPKPLTPYINNNILYWNKVNDTFGPITNYQIYMDNFSIYNGIFLKNGLDISSFLDNTHIFNLLAYTSTNTFSKSDNLKYNHSNVINNPPVNEDNEFHYWYIIIIAVVSLLVIYLLYLSCRNNNIEPENNTTIRNFENPIYEEDTMDESYYGFGGDFLERNEGSIVNNFYETTNEKNIYNTTDVNNNFTRKITKRRNSINNEYNTLERKSNLIEEIKERVPNLVPKNMIND